jgi:hypothetical protein
MQFSFHWQLSCGYFSSGPKVPIELIFFAIIVAKDMHPRLQAPTQDHKAYRMANHLGHHGLAGNINASHGGVIRAGHDLCERRESRKVHRPQVVIVCPQNLAAAEVEYLHKTARGMVILLQCSTDNGSEEEYR